MFFFRDHFFSLKTCLRGGGGKRKLCSFILLKFNEWVPRMIPYLMPEIQRLFVFVLPICGIRFVEFLGTYPFNRHCLNRSSSQYTWAVTRLLFLFAIYIYMEWTTNYSVNRDYLINRLRMVPINNKLNKPISIMIECHVRVLLNVARPLRWNNSSPRVAMWDLGKSWSFLNRNGLILLVQNGVITPI